MQPFHRRRFDNGFEFKDWPKKSESIFSENKMSEKENGDNFEENGSSISPKSSIDVISRPNFRPFLSEPQNMETDKDDKSSLTCLSPDRSECQTPTNLIEKTPTNLAENGEKCKERAKSRCESPLIGKYQIVY